MPQGEPRSPQSGPGERAGKSGRRGQEAGIKEALGSAVPWNPLPALAYLVLVVVKSGRARVGPPADPAERVQHRGRAAGAVLLRSRVGDLSAWGTASWMTSYGRCCRTGRASART